MSGAGTEISLIGIPFSDSAGFFDSPTRARGESQDEGKGAALLHKVDDLTYCVFHRKAYSVDNAGWNFTPSVIPCDLDMVDWRSWIKSQFANTGRC